MRSIYPILAAAVSLALVSGGTATAAAADPITGDDPAGTYSSPAHVWVDPTVAMSYSVDFHFPIPESHWVSHGSAVPIVTGGVSHCSITREDFGTTLSCITAGGTPNPGEFIVTVGVRSEAGDDFTMHAPLTVCPITGCSDLFDVTLSSDAWEVCPGEELSNLGPVEYLFNVAWNATNVEFTPISAAAGGTWDVTTESPTGGATFALEGALENPGEYALGVTVIDEFDGEHEASLPITVLEEKPGQCGVPAAATLAATGTDLTAPLVGMLALLASGTLALLVARRRRTTP